MKARKMLAGIWAVVMLLSGLGIAGFMTLPVVAQPNAHQFNGSILIDGLDAPAGTFVYAEIDGTLYGQDSDQVGGGYQGGMYGLAVSGEDPANAIAKEGGNDGENVIFWVKPPVGGPYIANQAPAFQAGLISNVDLTVQTMTQPVRVRMNQINITTGDWVLLYNPDGATTVDLTTGWRLEDSYGSGGAVSGSIPPMSDSSMTYGITLFDADGNVKLIWRDPLGTIAGGVDVVMDKLEWGPHLADSEATGGETIGLDKGDGSVWDPNLPDPCPPDMGYWRVDANVDRDIREDFNWTGVWCHYLPGVKQLPQLWPTGAVGYENDYVDPEIGDTATNFVWQVWYADPDNEGPTIGPDLHIWDSLTGTPLGDFPMVRTSWVGAPDMWTHPTDGAIYAYATTLPVGVDWCYNITVTSDFYNETLTFCDPDVGDVTPPDIMNVLLDGLPAQTVAPGTSVTLTTLIDDSMTGNSWVGGADWQIVYDPLPCGPWPGNATIPQDIIDSSTEVMMDVIDTTLLGDRDWRVYVRGWDAVLPVPNYNTTCPYAILTISSVDVMGPEIWNAQVDLPKVRPGTSVVLTATVDDTNDPENYAVGGAEYWIDVPTVRIGMNAVIPPFDNEVEDVTATVDTSGLADGTHQICIYAWDQAPTPNVNQTGTACASLDIDGTTPDVTALINGNPTATVIKGTPATLTATLNDPAPGLTNIKGANYTSPAQAWTNSTAMTPDDILDSPVEGFTDTIDTTNLGVGPYQICVYGSDMLDNNNTIGSCVTLIVIIYDDLEPVISNVEADYKPSIQIVYQSGDAFIFTGIVDDNTRGGSDIANASYLVRDGSGATFVTGVMNANDSSFDTPMEEVIVISIDTAVPADWAVDIYRVYIYACDANATANCNYTETEWATVQIQLVVDNDPPNITAVQADRTTIQEGDTNPIVLTATMDDTGTGGSLILSANYTVDGDWASVTPMQAVDANFDEVSEDVTADVDASGWGLGDHTLCVYGSDVVPNHNMTGSCVTITVQTGPIDTTPPDIVNRRADPSSVETGNQVTIKANVTDDYTSQDDLDVEVTVTDPDGGETTTDMTFNANTGDFEFPQTYTIVGTYTFVINATDEAGNYETSTGTFSVTAVPPPPPPDDKEGIPWWVWLLLILIIIVVIALIAVAATRKKPEEEELPPPEEEIEEVEEELPPEEEAIVEEELPPEEIPEEAPPEEVAPEEVPEEVAPEEAPPEEVAPEEVPEEVPEEAPAEEVAPEEAPPEEAPAEEAAPAGPISCPNCGTVNPEGMSVCTSCGSPL